MHQVHPQTTATHAHEPLQWQRSCSAHPDNCVHRRRPFATEKFTDLIQSKKKNSDSYCAALANKYISKQAAFWVLPHLKAFHVFHRTPGRGLRQRYKGQTRNWRGNENDCLTAEILQTKTKHSVLGQMTEILSVGIMSYLELHIWCHLVPPDHTSCFTFCVIKWPQQTGMSLATRQEKNKR